MSMSSFQPQQTGLVYPNTAARPPPTSSSHSDGSFGTVFIVLAVIVVISAIACCLGRLCNRRIHREKPPKHSHNFRHKERPERGPEFKPPKRNQSFRPRERENSDLEFGFDKNIAASKPAGKGESVSFKPFGNGDIRFEPKLADYGELKPGA
ncbi:Transmembrane protein [Melia azedarach]|uniref:Transmembrane protein n=1 Tax=Melia azedarach TaxID=155640 RepID=A0ACC1XI39_MELAZ|nr:Transmembrane protein [Melia azedarach]